MNFHVGQKVVCVNAEWSALFGPSRLVKGGVYTIASIAYADGLTVFGDGGAGHLVLVLQETTNSSNKTGGFDARRFKPVTYSKHLEKTDVALFTHHLTDQPVDA